MRTDDMAKRLTDCGKWDKVWFRKLSPVYKCFWVYICDRCDHAGVWEVDFEIASLYIGETINPEEVKEVFGKQFIELNHGSRWLIKDFLVFQYGNMNEDNKMYHTIESSLSRNGLKMGDVWGIDGGIVSVKVKDKVIVKDKDLHLDKVLLTKDEYAKLVEKYGAEGAKERIATLNNYAFTHPKKFKEYGSHYHVIETWARKDDPKTKVETWNKL